MSVSSSRMRIKSEFKDLLISWQRARETWRDPVSMGFERKRLLPMEGRIRATMTAMEKIESSLNQAKRDCGDD